MGKMRFKVSSVEYGAISKRERTNKRQNKALWLIVILAGLNFAWDAYNRQDQIKKVYNTTIEKAEQIYVDLQK